jgi:hypothetical protein
MSTTTSQTLMEYRAEQRRNELWRFWRRVAGIVATIAVVVVGALWANSMMQRYVVLGDDTARGEQLREALTAMAIGTAAERDQYIVDQCRIAAEAFYGHSITSDSTQSTPGDGYAPPNEKAFFVACSGWTLGGRGGGGSGD